jgi:hypothetical protein
MTKSGIHKKSKKYSNKSNGNHIAFSVSGGAFPYQMGVAYYLQKHFDLTNVEFSGSSGGSWPALLMAARIDMRYACDVLMMYGPNCASGRSLGAYCVYDQGVTEVFHRIFENIDLSKVLLGQLAISVTRLDWEFFDIGISSGLKTGLSNCLGFPYLQDEIVSNFYSNDDVVDCVIASALIPFAINGKPYVKFRDWICIDAGLTNIAGVRRFFSDEHIPKSIISSPSPLRDKNKIIYEDNPLNSMKSVPIADDYISPIVNYTYKKKPFYSPWADYLLGFASELDENTSSPTMNIMENGKEFSINKDNEFEHYPPSLCKRFWGTWSNLSPNNIVSIVKENGKNIIHDIENESHLPFSDEPFGLLKLAAITTKAVTANVVIGITNIFNDNSSINTTISSTTTATTVNISNNNKNESSKLNNCFDSIPVGKNNIINNNTKTKNDVNNNKSYDNNWLSEENILNEKQLKKPLNLEVLDEEDNKDNIVNNKNKLYLSPNYRHETWNNYKWKQKKCQNVKKIKHGGGKILEIAPWTWRQHPLSHYHLSSDPKHVEMLFNMGYHDACDNHHMLDLFFNNKK